MVLRFVLSVLAFANVIIALSQMDTVHLDEVSVLSRPFERFATGQDIVRIRIENTQTLTDALSSQPSIYFKNYGNGQLSTISFRGTSANHTSVLWHGIPVNYPSLGQSDFTQWPTWLLESVSLHPGGSGALYGSGAIGGSVLLDSDPILVKANQATARLEVGSFGQFFTGVKGSYLSEKWSGSTKAFSNFLQNDFDYQYQGKQETQQNASVLDNGIQQQVYFRPKYNQLFFLDAMYTTNDREVQPNMVDPDVSNELTTDNLRAVAGFQAEKIDNSITANLAWVRADQVYNQTDQTLTNQISSLVSYWQQLKEGLEFRVGTNVNLYMAQVDSYSEGFYDLQIDFFAGITFELLDFYQASLNLRQSRYDDSHPFTPSFGHEFSLLSQANHQIVFNQQVSVGYRYPTLNDRYWSPGGNPDLDPETSRTIDTGLEWAWSKNLFKAGFDLNGYFTNSDSWIVWIPTAEGFWAPSNLRSVEILGFESSAFLTVDFLDVLHEFSGGYSHTQSTNQTGSTKGNQLPYTPLHHFNFGWKSTLKYGLSTNLNYDFTGRRYTTLDNTAIQSVAGFGLWNFSIQSLRTLRNVGVATAFAIRNITNKSYENLINRAMPGRNYQISLTFTYSKNQ